MYNVYYICYRLAAIVFLSDSCNPTHSYMQNKSSSSQDEKMKQSKIFLGDI